MVKRLKRVGGVTLVELLIVLAILGSVALLTPPMFRHFTQFYILSRVRIQLQEESRNAMSLITHNLRQAQTSTIRIDQTSGQPYYSRLRFTKMQGTAMTYYQNGKFLYQLAGTSTSTLTTNLRYLAFTFPRTDDMSIISVSMTMEQAIYEGRTKALHMASEKVQVMND